MKFIVSWSLPSVSYSAATERFLKTGGAPPAGVNMLGRWHGMNGRGFAVAETDNPKALYAWWSEWRDLIDIEVTPCLEDADAGEVVAAQKG